MIQYSSFTGPSGTSVGTARMAGACLCFFFPHGLSSSGPPYPHGLSRLRSLSQISSQGISRHKGYKSGNCKAYACNLLASYPPHSMQCLYFHEQHTFNSCGPHIFIQGNKHIICKLTGTKFSSKERVPSSLAMSCHENGLIQSIMVASLPAL